MGVLHAIMVMTWGWFINEFTLAWYLVGVFGCLIFPLPCRSLGPGEGASLRVDTAARTLSLYPAREWLKQRWRLTLRVATLEDCDFLAISCRIFKIYLEARAMFMDFLSIFFSLSLYIWSNITTSRQPYEGDHKPPLEIRGDEDPGDGVLISR